MLTIQQELRTMYKVSDIPLQAGRYVLSPGADHEAQRPGFGAPNNPRLQGSTQG